MTVNLENVKKVLAIGTIALVAGTSFTGCHMQKTVVDNTEGVYDVLDSTQATSIEPQIIEVPGEDFKLVIEYSLDENAAKKWTITGDKSLFTRVYTQGLPEGTKVYIDNVHTDTSIVSTYPEMNGIQQDSMDDRIHNSLMYGFPISDTTHFVGINKIEGQNDTFITGTMRGFVSRDYGYVNGEIEEKRFLEEDYLKNGVYGNKIVSAYGLLIQKGDEEPYGIDVSSELVVLCSNQITKINDLGEVYIYQYNLDGSYQLVETKNTVTTLTKTK